MKKNQNQHWKDTISNMNPNNQIELVKIIIEELHLNEKSLDKSSNYDVEIASKLISILEDYIGQDVSKKEKRNVMDLLGRFTGLSLVSKKKTLDLVIPYFSRIIDEEVKSDNIKNCEQKGHEYSNSGWKKFEWTSYETISIDHQICDNYPIPHVKWKRECPNCGVIEESVNEPQEVKEQREKSEKQEKIKILRKELKDLGGI